MNRKEEGRSWTSGGAGVGGGSGRAATMDEIQKIVFEIADRCSRRRIPVNDMLAAFVAKTVILESPDRFQLDSALKPEDVEELVSLAVDRLGKEDDPSLETLRMQVTFDAAYVSRQEQLEKDRAAAKRSYGVIEQSICALKLQSTKDVGGMGQMHRLIVAALLTKTGQSTQNQVYQKEVAAALESVLPRANLHAFTSLSYSDKRDRLTDLHHYVLGIRLFNKAIGKGGTGLADKISEAFSATGELAQLVEQQLDAARQEVEEYSVVITHVLAQGEEAEASVPLKRLQDELTNRRQFKSFLESFHEEVSVNLERVQALAQDNEAELDELKDLVGRKSAVPKERVYPLFETLARKWTEAEEVTLHMGALRHIFEELQAFANPDYKRKLEAKYVEDAEKSMSQQQGANRDQGAHADGEAGGGGGGGDGKDGDGVVPTAVAGDKLVAALSGDSAEPVHVFRSDNPEIVGMNINFASFCPVSIVERDNLLLPGNPSNGFVLFKGKLYSFVSIGALPCLFALDRTRARSHACAEGCLSVSGGMPLFVRRLVPTRACARMLGGRCLMLRGQMLDLHYIRACMSWRRLAGISRRHSALLRPCLCPSLRLSLCRSNHCTPLIRARPPPLVPLPSGVANGQRRCTSS